jgi:hypothetical protein
MLPRGDQLWSGYGPQMTHKVAKDCPGKRHSEKTETRSGETTPNSEKVRSMDEVNAR